MTKFCKIFNLKKAVGKPSLRGKFRRGFVRIGATGRFRLRRRIVESPDLLQTGSTVLPGKANRMAMQAHAGSQQRSQEIFPPGPALADNRSPSEAKANSLRVVLTKAVFRIGQKFVAADMRGVRLPRDRAAAAAENPCDRVIQARQRLDLSSARRRHSGEMGAVRPANHRAGRAQRHAASWRLSLSQGSGAAGAARTRLRRNCRACSTHSTRIPSPAAIR